MAIRIGSDGTIYDNNQALEHSGGAVIRDDGTIEMNAVIATPDTFAPPRLMTRAAPVSPLERVRTEPNTSTSITQPGPVSPSRPRPAVTEQIAALEYDIRIAESKKKGYSPTKYYLIAGVCLALTIATSLSWLFLLATIVAGVFAVKNGVKAAEAERERQRLQRELDGLR